jgi:poly(hydroxyalkanoate) depolymerase family esterase
MRNIADTIERLARFRSRSRMPTPPAAPDRLTDIADFGSNPGALRARVYIPTSLSRGAPLVVVLHGCTQTAAGYDHGAGWSQLADDNGFAVLFAEQRRANNANLCFNWFAPDDFRRDRGEVLSIRQMIDAAAVTYHLDRSRIFVSGLSAGGAMAAAMLAAYPELFAGGAIIAGLPYGCAASVPEAFDRMRGHGGPDAPGLQALLRNASNWRGPWPKISIWHGTADRTVDFSNAEAIVDQWRAVHGVADAPSVTDEVDGYPRRAWRNAEGRDVIELYAITGMGHGTPLATQGAHGVGASGPFMIEAGISSTLHSAGSWGLLWPKNAAQPVERREPPAVANPPQVPAMTIEAPSGGAAGSQPDPGSALSAGGVRKIIEDALRAAGLMRS